MNPSFCIFVLLGLLSAICLLPSSHATPIENEDQPTQLEELEMFGRSSTGGDLVRLKRASCDLFSFSSSHFTPNHAVCAAHCIALGKRGGECKGTVCHCRK